MEDVVCSYCPDNMSNESIGGDLRGWIQTEFGWKCPECRILRPDDVTGTNVDVGSDPLIAFVEKNEKDLG